MAKILLATPTHDGMVTVAYTESLLGLMQALQGAVDLRPMYIGTALVAHARNAFASMVLEDPTFTHLLFVDADMGFAPLAVARMIAADKDFVGCIAPQRDIDLDRMHSISRQVEDPLRARMIAQNYAALALIPRELGNGKFGVVMQDGFVQAHQIGMGLTLIKRGALERMRDTYPELLAKTNGRYQRMGVREHVFQPFEATRNADGIYLGEDYSFCERWRAAGGEIWVCVDEVITHVGRKAFDGRYIERLAFESSGPMAATED